MKYSCDRCFLNVIYYYLELMSIENIEYKYVNVDRISFEYMQNK